MHLFNISNELAFKEARYLHFITQVEPVVGLYKLILGNYEDRCHPFCTLDVFQQHNMSTYIQDFFNNYNQTKMRVIATK